MIEKKIYTPDDLDLLRYDLDGAMQRGIKLQNFDEAKQIRRELDFGIESLKNYLKLFTEPFQYQVRRSVANHLGAAYVSLFDTDGNGWVKVDEKYSIVDFLGNVISEVEGSILGFSDGMFRCHFDEITQFVDTQGVVKFCSSENVYRDFSSGLLASHCYENGKRKTGWQYVDKNGDVVFDKVNNLKILSADRFSEGLAPVILDYKSDNNSVFIRPDGKMERIGKWTNIVSGFREGLAVVYEKTRIWKKYWMQHYIDRAGKRLPWSDGYDVASSFYSGYAVTEKGDAVNLIRIQGPDMELVSSKSLVQVEFSNYSILETGRLIQNLTAMRNMRPSTLFDFDGNEIYKSEHKINYFQEGVFRVGQDRMIDRFGDEIFSDGGK